MDPRGFTQYRLEYKILQIESIGPKVSRYLKCLVYYACLGSRGYLLIQRTILDWDLCLQYGQHPGPWYRFRVHLSRPRNAYGYVLLIPTTCGLRHYFAREALFHRPMDCNPGLLLLPIWHGERLGKRMQNPASRRRRDPTTALRPTELILRSRCPPEESA